MAKYSEKIVKEICDLLATGEHRIVDVCKQVGISEAIYYKWKETKVEFLEALKEAEKKRLSEFKHMARSGLAKLLDVYEYEEEHTEYKTNKEGETLISSKKVIKKRVMPNSTAVIFALCNRDPENFKNIQKVDITSKGDKVGQSIDLSKLDDETLRKLQKAKAYDIRD